MAAGAEDNLDDHRNRSCIVRIGNEFQVQFFDFDFRFLLFIRFSVCLVRFSCVRSNEIILFWLLIIIFFTLEPCLNMPGNGN